MARVKRVEQFHPDEVATLHVMNRIVRRCRLMGDDPVSGKNFDHRKRWVEAEIERSAANFGIDLIAYALMPNHLHLVLRSRPDVVKRWDDTEVARRWFMLCPQRKDERGRAAEPSEAELDSIRNNEAKVKEIRRRLSDISWWMRLMCQRIGQRANAEDEEKGKFWQSRYHAVRLLDEAAILSAAAYVDLNPIRAALAETIEDSDFTSAQRRCQSAALDACNDLPQGEQPDSSRPDRFLSPVQIDELRDALCSAPSASPHRCTDKGFVAMTAADYLQLLDWTARQMAPGKFGTTPADAPELLERLSISPSVWQELTSNFGSLFRLVAGQPEFVDEYRSKRNRSRFNLPRRTRELLTTGST